jgi:hypothetical protein
MCNVIMVDETFTIFVTQLLTFKGACSHMQINIVKRETLYIFRQKRHLLHFTDMLHSL